MAERMGRLFGWLVLAVLMLAGVLIRQFFVLRHRGQQKWWLPAAGAALIVALIVLMAPKGIHTGGKKITFAEAKQVIDQRCVSCHAAQPTREGFVQPPKGVMLENATQIGQHIAKIKETVTSGYMPLGNLTGMTDEERNLILVWAAQGARLTD